MKKRSFKAPVNPTTITTTTTTCSAATTTTAAASSSSSRLSSNTPSLMNSIKNTNNKPMKNQGEKLNAKSLTDEDYEELFDSVLRQSLIEECCRGATRADSHAHIGQSPKEYASLQPVALGEGSKSAADFAMDTNGSPGKGRRVATDNTTPTKAAPLPAWRSVSPIAEMKETNRRRLNAEKDKSTGAKASFSLGNFRKDKENVKPKKSKADDDVGNPPFSKKRKMDENRQQEVDSWSLTQECTKGVWVQCANDHCCKWRHLDYVHDPSNFINVRWTCADNQDKCHNSCDAPVEQWDEHADWTYNRYTEGSLVWARVDGYPWWPAMIEIDPDLEAFVFCYEHSTYTPVEYHVTFFDCEKATRAWLLPKHVKPFHADCVNQELSGKMSNKRLMHAVKQAQECASLSLAQRLRTFSFTLRYDGKIVGSKATGAINYLQSTSAGAQARKPKRSRPTGESKSTRQPRSEKKKTTPTSAVRPTEAPKAKLTAKANATDMEGTLTEASCSALLPVPADTATSAVSSKLPSPANESTRHLSPANESSRQLTPANDSTRHVSPANESIRHVSPVNESSRQLTPANESSRQVSPANGTQQSSSAAATDTNEPLEKLDFEKELDEIESILSQSLMSQKSASLSPAPGRNLPLASSGSRENSQSNRGTNSQSGDSQSQTGESQLNRSQSQRTSTPSPHRVKAVGGSSVGKKVKKGFKCPAISPSSSQSNSESKAALSLANNSLFTQELSTGTPTQQSTGVPTQQSTGTTQQSRGTTQQSTGTTQQSTGATQQSTGATQQSTVFDQGLRLTGNSIFTQELSGKDPFISATANPFTKAADLASTVDAAPEDCSQLKLADNSLYTQELSAKNPFTCASKIVSEGNGLDISIFTQELSNEPNLKSEETIANRHKFGDVNPLDIIPEC